MPIARPPYNKALNSALQMAAVPFWHQPFLAKPSGWRFSTPLIADPLGAGKQVNPSDFLSLIAELGVALVAAAGIVTAIGGRGRVYTPLDRATIRGLVVVAATPLAIALLGLVMLSADASTARIWSSVSYAYVSVVVIRYALTFPDSIRVRIQDPSLPRRGLVVSTVLSVGVALFLLHNAVVLATFWPIVAACSYEILIAVWLILRLLLGSRFGATEPPSD